MKDQQSTHSGRGGGTDADRPHRSDVCPRCGRSPCECPAFPEVLTTEQLEYAPPEADPDGSR